MASFGAAQTTSASVVGRVTDPAGAVVPGATIKITNVDTNLAQQANSNGTGDFTVPFLSPGPYILEASAAGFRSYNHAEISLAVDQILRLDIALEVAAPTESVTLNATVSVPNTESPAPAEARYHHPRA